MNNKEFKEIMNTLLNAKLTDFCGKDTYEVLMLGNLFHSAEEKYDMLNYTLKDFIKMYSKIMLPQDEVIRKLPGEENFQTRAHIYLKYQFKRKVYLHVLYTIFTTATHQKMRILSDETVNVIGKEFFIRNNGDFDPNLKDIIKKFYNMKVNDYLYEIGSLYARNINQMQMLLHCYSKLKSVLNPYRREAEYDKRLKEAIDMTIDEIDVGRMLFLRQRCDDECDLIRTALIMNPFRIACGVTVPFCVDYEGYEWI